MLSAGWLSCIKNEKYKPSMFLVFLKSIHRFLENSVLSPPLPCQAKIIQTNKPSCDRISDNFRISRRTY